MPILFWASAIVVFHFLPYGDFAMYYVLYNLLAFVGCCAHFYNIYCANNDIDSIFVFKKYSYN